MTVVKPGNSCGRQGMGQWRVWFARKLNERTHAAAKQVSKYAVEVR